MATKDLFLRRTAQAFRNHKARAARCFARLNYDLAALRHHLRTLIMRCRYCNILLSARDFSLDHSLPIARGGSWGLENLALCCRPCNEAKGALAAAEFNGLLAEMDRWRHPEARANVLKRLRAGGKLIRSA